MICRKSFDSGVVPDVSGDNGSGGFLRGVNFIFSLEQHIEGVSDLNFSTEPNGHAMLISPIKTLECK